MRTANNQRDIAQLPNLASEEGRVAPVRTRMPVYVDLLPPCNNACPAGENIQEWLRLVREGQPEEAWRVITKDNPFPAIHGRVCYHRCETACNRAELDSAVSIHSVERWLGDQALKHGWSLETTAKRSGKRVLVVGAGPSGLSAAYHLAMLGHAVEIYDQESEPGGMMRYGIPEYRLPRNILDAEIERLTDLGVVIHTNRKVEDLLEEQKSGNFDAVFVAVGAHLSKNVELPTVDPNKIVDAITFLRAAATGTQERDLKGKKIAVYGGGNTAMDAARVAQRLGAKETMIVYRRTEKQMPANPEELDEARHEGVAMHWLRTIKSVDADGITVEIMELDETGKPRGTGKTEKLNADIVILALGQVAGTEFLRNIPGMTFEDDVVQVNPQTLMTDVPGIFAGGDAVPSDRTVTIGVGHGKRAAREIDAWLGNRTRVPAEKHPLAEYDGLNLWYFGDHKQRRQPELKVEERTDFTEVVSGLTEEQALFEAGRCLSCGNCMECDGCLGSCPEGAVIKLGKGYRYRFDYSKCIGCGTCYEQCPVHAINMIPEK